MQHRAFDLFGCFLVRSIVFDVNRCRGYILLENLRAEGTAAEGVIEHGPRSAKQIALWQRFLLRQQNPGPIGLSEARIRSGPPFADSLPGMEAVAGLNFRRGLARS